MIQVLDAWYPKSFAQILMVPGSPGQCLGIGPCQTTWHAYGGADEAMAKWANMRVKGSPLGDFM